MDTLRRSGLVGTPETGGEDIIRGGDPGVPELSSFRAGQPQVCRVSRQFIPKTPMISSSENSSSRLSRVSGQGAMSVTLSILSLN